MLAACVTDHLPPDGETTWLNQSGVSTSVLPQEIERLKIARYDFLEESYWAYTRAGFEAELGVDELRTVVREKEARISSYRKTCDEVWLMIVFEGLHPSSFYRVPAAVCEESYETAFSKLLVLDYSREGVVDLTVREPAGV